jgi:GDPmannose 4,6-dehydratase
MGFTLARAFYSITNPAFAPQDLFTRKVVLAASRIANGSKEELLVGETRVKRDWGWAPEYVEAMWMMLQQAAPRDYVIAKGESHTLEEFISAVFEDFGLDWRKHTRTDSKLFRVSDISESHADPTRAQTELGWQARTRMRELVSILTQQERQSLASGPSVTQLAELEG